MSTKTEKTLFLRALIPPARDSLPALGILFKIRI